MDYWILIYTLYLCAYGGRGTHLLSLTHVHSTLQSYWVSLLHKQLVGTRVLTVENGLKYGRSVRVYAHCTKYQHTQKSV